MGDLQHDHDRLHEHDEQHKESRTAYGEPDRS